MYLCCALTDHIYILQHWYQNLCRLVFQFSNPFNILLTLTMIVTSSPLHTKVNNYPVITCTEAKRGKAKSSWLRIQLIITLRGYNSSLWLWGWGRGWLVVARLLVPGHPLAGACWLLSVVAAPTMRFTD